MTEPRRAGAEQAGPSMARIALAVVARPSLWPTATVQIFRLARRGWWRTPPFLPLPERGYLAFREHTHRGGQGPSTVADVVAYLEWCRHDRVRR